MIRESNQGAGADDLATASQRGDVGAITALLEAGADVNQLATDGVSPLHFASQEGHVGAITALLGAGAEVNQSTTDGVSPLHSASHNGHVGAIRALLGAGAEVNQPTTDGVSPLHAASNEGRADAIRALLEAGAEVNQLTINGETPLRLVSQRGHQDPERRGDYSKAAIALIVADGAINNEAEIMAALWGFPGTEADMLEIIQEEKKAIEEKEAQKRSWSELREAWINAVVVSAAAREPVAPGGAPVVASEGVAVKTLNPEREGR